MRPRLAYFDCPSGIAGDMVLGALVDAGVPLALLHDVAARLGLPDVELRCREHVVRGFRALRVDMAWDEGRHAAHRNLADIAARVEAAGLDAPVREGALRVFRTLAEAEARVHGRPVEEIHFHEVGAVDAIVDVDGAAAGLAHLGVGELHASPLPMGSGTVRCAHGELPLPAPAVAQMLPGVPVYGAGVAGETVTPTGLALLRGLGARFGPWPAMEILAVGTGAGHHDLGLPGPLRLFVGEPAADTRRAPDSRWEDAVVLEANIDDMNPQHYELAMERLFAGGARDVWIEPILMKKGRPAHRLAVLGKPDDADALAEILLRETTTIGVRRHAVSKRALEREMTQVATPWGPVPVKLVRLGGELLRAIPEYDDLKRLAAAAGVPIAEVSAAARAALPEGTT